MRPAFVADVGNSRTKWGRCDDGHIADTVSLPPDDSQAWQQQRELWSIGAGTVWIVTGVHPQRRDNLAEWLRQRGDHVQVLQSSRQLPLRVLVREPECVGIDRLLNAVAASRRVPQGVGAVIVDAGSAITVDWLDETGTFAGGSIFPGLRLMAQALHDYTALLPLVQVTRPAPPLPGTSTVAAIEAGVFWAAVGGVQALITRLGARATSAPLVFVTGGDGALLTEGLLECGGWTPLWMFGSLDCAPNPNIQSGVEPPHSKIQSGVEPPHSKIQSGVEPPHSKWIHLWPNMTLEGICIAALGEATP